LSNAVVSGALKRSEDIIDRLGRPRIIPVVSTWNTQVLSDIDAPEAEVSVVEGTFMVKQLQDEERNIGVEANIMTGLAPQIALEIPQATSKTMICVSTSQICWDITVKDGLVRCSIIRTMREAHCFATS